MDLFLANAEHLRTKRIQIGVPLAKARSLSKSQRAATAKKKKRSGKFRQFVKNTLKAKVKS